MKISVQNDLTNYYGHGKLLITGEYFVLDGARALAVPTRLGQWLRVKELNSAESVLYWVALTNQGKVWLNLVFDITDFKCLNSNTGEAQRLSKILSETRKLNPDFLKSTNDLAIETRLEFPNAWGLGSSSTLIHCIAQWANVDGYTLLQNTIGGSGYDVACAAHNSAILYQLQNGKPETLAANWQPPFKQQIYFAYLGKKQLSSEAIKYYKEKLDDKSHGVNQLTRITELVLKCTTLNEFEELMSEHENIVAANLKLIKVKDALFSDYWGSVKSLGAWGGDFVLITNNESRDTLEAYLKTKEIGPLFSWEELLLPA